MNYQRVAPPPPPLRRVKPWPLPQHSKQRSIPTCLPLYNINYTRTNLTCHIFPICYNFSFSFNIIYSAIKFDILLYYYSILVCHRQDIYMYYFRRKCKHFSPVWLLKGQKYLVYTSNQLSRGFLNNKSSYLTTLQLWYGSIIYQYSYGWL